MILDDSFMIEVRRRMFYGERFGQAVFNVAYQRWPDKVNNVRGGRP